MKEPDRIPGRDLPAGGVREPAAWEPGKCRVPLWCMGVPDGYCGEPTMGPQLPLPYLRQTRGWSSATYCFGPCCPSHGGPRTSDPIIFQDGHTEQGRPMYCAVRHDFENLQESPAGFGGDPLAAVIELGRAIADTSPGKEIPGSDKAKALPPSDGAHDASTKGGA
jgi:hypothetical protein